MRVKMLMGIAVLCNVMLAGCGGVNPITEEQHRVVERAERRAAAAESNRIALAAARTNPPPGFTIQCSMNGKYRWAVGDYAAITMQDSRSQAVYWAWSRYDKYGTNTGDAVPSPEEWKDCE